MSVLPLEILRLTSQYLIAKDLTQFQLVNKKWHEASVASLYSNVALKQDDQAVLYIRTISNSSKHGLFLKSINVSSLFDLRLKFDPLWDRHDLFDALITHCPNLQRISTSQNHHSILWIRLMEASMEGKLLNFKELPSVSNETIPAYVSTALCYKKSLTALTLADHIGIISNYRNKNTTAFLKLRRHIKEFLNLKKLTVYHHTNQPFSHLDTLIEECPLIKELEVTLFYSGDLVPETHQNVLVKPRPDINKLNCTWRSICEDDQLKYILQKFPNIQHLEINAVWRNGYTNLYDLNRFTSYNVTIEFIRYLSLIPTLDIAMIFKREYLMDYWNEFTRLNPRDSPNVHIVLDIRNDVNYSVMIYNKTLLKLRFPVNPTDTSLPHEDFIHQHGSMIKKLELEGAEYARIYANRGPVAWLLHNENWIYQILQSCPSLEELTLREFIDLLVPVNNPYRHIKLKKVHIVNEERPVSLKFLRNLSVHAPNLDYLCITTMAECEEDDGDDLNVYRTSIDMPCTFFDHLCCIFNYDCSDLVEYYIKLNTTNDIETKYFIADERGARKITGYEYYNSSKTYDFEISCGGLKVFSLTVYDNDDKFSSYCKFNEE